MSEHIPIDEARYLAIDARKDELDRLEAYVDKNEEIMVAFVVRRHILARRAMIVALATRPPEPEGPLETKVGERTINEWHARLTGDDLETPVSRFGKSASQCAWWAVAAVIIHAATEADTSDLDDVADSMMSMAVNSRHALHEFVIGSEHLVPDEVLKHLDGEDE